MQIAVIGAGAIGGILAEATHLAGHDVTLCVRTPVPSLQIERDGKITPVPVAIATKPPGEGAARADWILLATKAHQTAGTREWIMRLAGRPPCWSWCRTESTTTRGQPISHTQVPSCPPSPTSQPSEQPPGHIIPGWGRQIIVPRNDHGAAFARMLTGSGIDVEQDEDFRTAAWRKLLTNVAASPITALTERPIGVLAEPGIRDLARALLTEAVAAATAEGAVLSAADVTATLDLYARLGPDAGTSMLDDRKSGRPTEHDLINGAVVRAAARHHQDAPLNRTVLALLEATSPSVTLDQR